MLAVLEMIEKENQMYINRGRAQGKRERKEENLRNCKKIVTKRYFKRRNIRDNRFKN